MESCYLRCVKKWMEILKLKLFTNSKPGENEVSKSVLYRSISHIISQLNPLHRIICHILHLHWWQVLHSLDLLALPRTVDL